MDDRTKREGFDFWEKTLGSPKFILAPMVDQSELAWRLLSRRYGAQLCYSPMFHATVFVRDARYRKEALATCPEDRPLIVQFCANNPDTFLKAAKLAEDHCDAIDLNLGCPQNIAKRGHYGSFLQDEWELLEKMVSECHKNLKVPITCKIRIFKDKEKTIRYAQMLEKAGCQMLTVHGRTREMKGQMTGLADWSYVKAVRENVSIPVISNGNIQYLHDVQKCLEETGVQGIMTAEGNLCNPALFAGIQPCVWQMALEYLELVKKYPCPMSYVRGHLFKMLHHSLQKHLDVRDVLSRAKTVEMFENSVILLKETCQPDVEKYEKDPNSLKSDLPHPYWVCQPYVRPGPAKSIEEDQKKKAQRKENLKRHIDGSHANLSLNKQKKLSRNPNKNFEKPPKPAYEPCVKCKNPKGKKCDHNLCKTCCKSLTYRETMDCVGHKYWNLSRKLRRDKEAQSENGNHCGNTNEENNGKATCDQVLITQEVEMAVDDVPIPNSNEVNSARDGSLSNRKVLDCDR